MKMIRGLEQLSYEDKLRGMGLFNLERKLWEDLTAAVQQLKEACKRAGGELFRRSCSDRAGGGMALR